MGDYPGTTAGTTGVRWRVWERVLRAGAASDWLEHGLPGRSERTREIYHDALAPLLAKIGKRPLRDLTAGEIEAGLRSLTGNLSSRSLQIAHNSGAGFAAAITSMIDSVGLAGAEFALPSRHGGS
jgi:hypothetical protein